MTNPYLSSSTTRSRVPLVRPISWLATIPQLLAVMTAVTAGWLLTKSFHGVALGAAVYLIYSIGSRQLIARAHRRGIRLQQNHQYEQAIRAFEHSYDFFTRHSWLDRYRAITMMSLSAMSYREMALLNIAFAHSQLGSGEKAKEYYCRTVDEFPDNAMARAALNFIDAVTRSEKNAEPNKGDESN